MAGLITRYVNYSSSNSAGGDGTTSGVSGTTRAYASLAEAESQEQTARADLVTATEVLEIIVIDTEGNGDSSQVTFAGYTTNTTYYIIIRVDSGSYHNMTASTGFIMNYNGNGACLTISQTGTIVEGISFNNAAINNGRGLDIGSAIDGCIIVKCMGTTGGTDNEYLEAVIRGNSADFIAINCMAFNASMGISCRDFAAGAYLYNCTAIDCGVGFEGRGTGAQYPQAYNCVAFGNTTNWAGDWDDADSSHNATGDATVGTMAGADGGTNEATLVTSVVSGDFNAYASDDFTIASSGSALEDAGTSLSSAFSTLSRTDYTVSAEDAFGVSRPQGSAWDIGMDELAASAAPLYGKRRLGLFG